MKEKRLTSARFVKNGAAEGTRRVLRQDEGLFPAACHSALASQSLWGGWSVAFLLSAIVHTEEEIKVKASAAAAACKGSHRNTHALESLRNSSARRCTQTIGQSTFVLFVLSQLHGDGWVGTQSKPRVIYAKPFIGSTPAEKWAPQRNQIASQDAPRIPHPSAHSQSHTETSRSVRLHAHTIIHSETNRSIHWPDNWVN